MRGHPVLKCYRLDGVAHLINETHNGQRKRFRAHHLMPGDIVRNQLFEDDATDRVRGPFPVGVIVWCGDSNTTQDVGVLWSGDPDT